MARVAIIDYGVGNLRSVEKAFAATGQDAIVTSNKEELRKAKRLVLPGVGAFAACMSALHEYGLVDLVLERVKEGVPTLGVCVGMQMLFEGSDEFGKSDGLGLLKGRVRRFSDDLIVPQVGWNRIHQNRQHPLFSGIVDDSFFYFVHSYFCEPEDGELIVGETSYGRNYASVVASNNVCGVQFHPEKSQSVGLKMLANFAECEEL
jgi:imidazole glycerol phosphate synthase, glutamine amidotransferase subunit